MDMEENFARLLPWYRDPIVRGLLRLAVFLRIGSGLDIIEEILNRATENQQAAKSRVAEIGVLPETEKLHEEIKKQAADLEKVKYEFLSVMSHELRTPLNVIMGYTQMLSERTLGDINQEQEKALKHIISRASDVLNTINSILDATKLESELLQIERHEVNLGDFLDELRFGYNVPPDKELTLNWDYPSDLPPIYTDTEKLMRILQNLISNAIKFTKKGHITISARYLPETKKVEFEVADTGTGISKEALPFIFERFRQADSSETRALGGVGLGLSIAKRFTEILGGTLEVDSEPGKGSTFSVTIPSN
jgi:signal transduction histidine kinase